MAWDGDLVFAAGLNVVPAAAADEAPTEGPQGPRAPGASCIEYTQICVIVKSLWRNYALDVLRLKAGVRSAIMRKIFTGLKWSMYSGCALES